MQRAATKLKLYLKRHSEIFKGDVAYHLSCLRHAPDMSDLIWEIKKGFKKNIMPVRSKHGCSESYFLKDENGEIIALFKLGSPLAEYAAYRLDHQHFAGVPQTVLTTLTHSIWGGKQTGSCQFFIEEATSTRTFNHWQQTIFTATSVRRVACLDIRLLNEDRNESNFLVLPNKELIPVDHGLVLTTELGAIDYVWTTWEQAATHFSSEEAAYIELLDPEEDRRILIDELQFSESVANRMYVATILLKEGIARKMTALQLGRFFKSRSLWSNTSDFHYLLDNLRQRTASWYRFRKIVIEEIKKLMDSS